MPLAVLLSARRPRGHLPPSLPPSLRLSFTLMEARNQPTNQGTLQFPFPIPSSRSRHLMPSLHLSLFLSSPVHFWRVTVMFVAALARLVVINVSLFGASEREGSRGELHSYPARPSATPRFGLSLSLLITSGMALIVFEFCRNHQCPQPQSWRK